ncbi:uncharacterized protein LOC123258849 [Cotesia glomerata]|uniref:uncharacterized protein LOC123258849 n=1 Tax=Cotesia glomerata TaxID=32391 RepID=UPI001D034961|nr:uncharacterized protein LOC123258849 [Cotesia glomerata]
MPVLSEIAVKRDKHFLETQNTVGSALSALGAAISMVLNRESDEIDQEKFLEYLSHTGQLLTDVFFQQSVARKSFITPLLSKTIKPAIDASKADEWLYGKNFTEQVKEAKTIEKTTAGIKAADKQATKSTWSKNKDQGNGKNPPAKYRQVGQFLKKPTIKFRSRTQNTSQSTSQSSSRQYSKSKSQYTSRK